MLAPEGGGAHDTPLPDGRAAAAAAPAGRDGAARGLRRMDAETKKRLAAEGALEYVETGAVVGVGTGSTTNHFIDALARIRGRLDGTVASSEATAARLRERGLRVADLNAVDEVSVYVDGADECTRSRQLVKGAGGALTREKILAAAARRFVCILDDSKLVDVLGTAAPVPVEVIPMARGYAARRIVALGGNPFWREGAVTDNGNVILDVHGLDLVDPAAAEGTLNQITGTVANGIFARRRADVVIIGTGAEVRKLS